MFKRTAAALLLVLAVGLTACGGDDDPETASTTTTGATTTTEAPTTTEDPRSCGGQFTRNCYEQVVIDAETAHWAMGAVEVTADQVECIAAATAAELTDTDLRSWVEDVIDAANPVGPTLEAAIIQARYDASTTCGLF